MASPTDCAICLDPFTSPRSLPCLHTYCTKCLEDLIGERRRGTIRCPECRLDIQIPKGGPESFPTNRYVVEMMRTQKNASAQKGHTFKQHAFQYTNFCDEKTCQVLLCPTCIVEHRDHKLIDITDKADQIRDKLKELKTKTIDWEDRFTKQIMKMNITKDIVNTSASKALDEVDNARSKQLKELENANASLGACGGASVEAEMEAVRGMPITATEVKSWKALGPLLSSNPSGKIYVARIGCRQMQAFDMNGNKKMETNATNVIKGMACHNAGDQCTLVIAMVERIELRDGVRGNLLDMLKIPGFKQNVRICQDSQDTVLIGGEIRGQWKAIQCIIKDGKITQGNKQINIELQKIYGLTYLIHNNKKYVVATDYDSKSIVAVDFDTGAEMWRIQNVVYNDKQVGPWGICTDGGSHLLLVDYNAKRILVLDMEGEIKGELITNIPGWCYHVTCIRSLNKLAVTNYNGDYYVGVYDVEYDI